MSETEAGRAPPNSEAPDASQRYFCYQCNKDVAVEGSQSGMTCTECQGGFLEAIATVNPEFRRRHRRRRAAPGDVTNSISLSDALEHMYPQQMLQMVQILLGAARNNQHRPLETPGIEPEPHAPQGEEPPAAPEGGERHNSEDGESDGETGGLRLELESFDLNDEDDEWEEAEEEEAANHNEGVAARAGGEGEVESLRGEAESLRSDFNFYMRELLQSLMDHNLEVRVELPDFYLGNPGDYLDSVGFEQLLQQLAESDNSRRGAPPAAKSAVEKLEMVKISRAHIESGIAVCAICKEQLMLDEPAKQLPCFHLYHQDCILPWLSSRNSCPVCRYELPTDDPDYEEQKKSKKGSECGASGNSSDLNSNAASGGGSESSGSQEEGCSSEERRSEGRSRRGIVWLAMAIGPVVSVMGLVLVASRLVGGEVMTRLPLNLFQAGAGAGGPGDSHWWFSQ